MCSKKSFPVRQSQTDIEFIKQSQLLLKGREVYSSIQTQIEKSKDGKYKTVYIQPENFNMLS